MAKLQLPTHHSSNSSNPPATLAIPPNQSQSRHGHVSTTVLSREGAKQYCCRRHDTLHLPHWAAYVCKKKATRPRLSTQRAGTTTLGDTCSCSSNDRLIGWVGWPLKEPDSIYVFINKQRKKDRKKEAGVVEGEKITSRHLLCKWSTFAKLWGRPRRKRSRCPAPSTSPINVCAKADSLANPSRAGRVWLSQALLRWVVSTRGPKTWW